MLKRVSFLTIILLITSILFGQQIVLEDYKVYGALIGTEVLDNTASVTIIKNTIDSQETSENTYLTVTDLIGKDINWKYQVYNWTENSKKERPTIIDSIHAEFLIDYCKSKHDKFTLTNNFNQSYKTIIIQRNPIRRKSVEQDWKNFYKVNPGSAGIFAFSNISYYSKDKTTAVFYYWHRQQGLSGHGALAVMIKVNDEWQLKYKTYVWQN